MTIKIDTEAQTDPMVVQENIMTQTSNKSQSTNNYKRRQTIAVISRNGGVQSSTPNSRDSRRHSIANKSPLFSKKLTFISDKKNSPLNQPSSTGSHANQSSSIQRIKSSKTGGDGSGKDPDGHGHLGNSIYEAESSS